MCVVVLVCSFVVVCSCALGLTVLFECVDCVLVLFYCSSYFLCVGFWLCVFVLLYVQYSVFLCVRVFDVFVCVAVRCVVFVVSCLRVLFICMCV